MNEINNKNYTNNLSSPKSRHKKWRFASNASYQFPSSIMGAVQGGFLLGYYEIVIGLNAWLIFLAMTCFIIYDASNDPIIGFLVDRNFKWTRKWGRRFPWIAIGIIPWILSIILIFSVPDIDASTNPWPIFGWLLLSLFVYDTFSSLVNVNNSALRPDMFRTEDERRRFSKYYTPIDIFAVILGMLLPALFIDFFPGDPKASYALMAWILAIVSIIFAILYIPGAREDKLMIERYFSSDYKRMKFFQGLWKAIKMKSFIVFFIFTICYGITISIIVANMLYLTTFVLQVGGDIYIIILGIYLLGTLISLPFWLWYLKKINNNKKAFTVGGLAYCAALVPLTFFQGLPDLLVMGFILGFANGCTNAFIFTVLYPSVIDDFVVRTGKNQKGILLGIFTMLNRLVATFDELIFAIVHFLTGFVPGKITYAEMDAVADMNLVEIGIRLLTGIIPAVILLVGTLVFWKFFPLTQDVILDNKVKLEELKF